MESRGWRRRDDCKDLVDAWGPGGWRWGGGDGVLRRDEGGGWIGRERSVPVGLGGGGREVEAELGGPAGMKAV